MSAHLLLGRKHRNVRAPHVDVSARPCDCDGSEWTRVVVAGVERTTRCACFIAKHRPPVQPFKPARRRRGRPVNDQKSRQFRDS